MKTYKFFIILLVIFLLVKYPLEYKILKAEWFTNNSFNIFGLTFYYYALFLLGGGLLIAFCIEKYRKFDKSLSNLDISDLIIYTIIPIIIGARAWHLMTDWHFYTDRPIEALYIWNGGLGIYGAVLGGILGGFLYSKRSKVNFWSLLNIAAFFLPLGQIIGRYGNLFNRELYGKMTSLPWGIQINNPVEAGQLVSGNFHPAYLYEQIGNIILFAVHLLLFHKFKFSKKIYIFTWMIGYGFIRFCVEFIRFSEKGIFGVFSFNQIVSLVIILAGLMGFFITHYKMVIIKSSN